MEKYNVGKMFNEFEILDKHEVWYTNTSKPYKVRMFKLRCTKCNEIHENIRQSYIHTFTCKCNPDKRRRGRPTLIHDDSKRIKQIIGKQMGTITVLGLSKERRQHKSNRFNGVATLDVKCACGAEYTITMQDFDSLTGCRYTCKFCSKELYRGDNKRYTYNLLSSVRYNIDRGLPIQDEWNFFEIGLYKAVMNFKQFLKENEYDSTKNKCKKIISKEGFVKDNLQIVPLKSRR